MFPRAKFRGKPYCKGTHQPSGCTTSGERTRLSSRRSRQPASAPSRRGLTRVPLLVSRHCMPAALAWRRKRARGTVEGGYPEREEVRQLDADALTDGNEQREVFLAVLRHKEGGASRAFFVHGLPPCHASVAACTGGSLGPPPRPHGARGRVLQHRSPLAPPNVLLVTLEL